MTAQDTEDLRLMTDSARDFAMIFTDPERKVVRWSAGAETVLGWTEQEAIGKSDLIFTPEDIAAGIPQQEQDTALREGRAVDERWHRKKDGTRFWASGVMTPLYDPVTGNLRGFGKVLRDMTHQKRIEEQLQASQEQLRLANEGLEVRLAERTAQMRDLSRRALSQIEGERRRISRELHDQTGQHLAALGLTIVEMDRAAEDTRTAARIAAQATRDAARVAAEATQAAEIATEIATRAGATAESVQLARIASEAARTAAIAGTDAAAASAAASAALAIIDAAALRLALLRSLNQSLSQDIHRIAVELRPTALDDLGLVAALRAHLEQWEEINKIAATLEGIGLEEGRDASHRLSGEIEITLYRIAQEALTNVSKHAQQATHVGITLQRMHGHVLMTIEDDGPGFDVETASEGRLGLAGMRERAILIGGTLEVESEPGSGTTIYARLPVDPQAPSPTPTLPG